MSIKWLAILSALALSFVPANTSHPSISSAQQLNIPLPTIGVAFTLPKGYAILQREMSEGSYATVISFGREFRPGHLRVIDLQLKFWPTGHDGFRVVPERKPSEFIDVEYKRVKEYKRKTDPDYDQGLEYTTLFGNKAVRYTIADFLCCMSIVGYLRGNQLSESAARHSDEYLVRIDSGGVDDEAIALFNIVAKSLRVIKVVASSSKDPLPASPQRRIVTLKTINVGLEMPQGFSAFQLESHEGFYSTTVYFGKHFRPAHWRLAPLEIAFTPTSKPIEEIDAEFQRIDDSARRGVPGHSRGPEYVRLFGNKAIRYTTYGLDHYTTILGYLNKDQLPADFRILGGRQYLARITIAQSIPDAEFNQAYKELIDTVLNSMRATK